MKRGSTTEVLNEFLDGPTSDVNNGWRNVEATRGKMSRYSTRQRHTHVLQDVCHQLISPLGM
jgi:hypothetical protein